MPVEIHAAYPHTSHALMFIAGICAGMLWGLFLTRLKR